MARGAIISMLVVVLILPSMFMIFDKVIVRTSSGFLPKTEEHPNKKKNRFNKKNKISNEVHV